MKAEGSNWKTIGVTSCSGWTAYFTEDAESPIEAWLLQEDVLGAGDRRVVAGIVEPSTGELYSVDDVSNFIGMRPSPVQK